MASNTTTAESSGETAKFELGPTTRVITDDGRDVVPGSGELGRVALPGTHTDRLLQGRGEVGADIRGDRRRALLDPRRLRHRRGRRHRHPARARQPVHQHRRREGVPRRGRGVPQAAPHRWPTPPSSACPTRSGARRSPRSSSRMPATSSTPGELIAHVKSRARRLQGTQAGDRRHLDRPRRERQTRLQAACGPTPSQAT